MDIRDIMDAIEEDDNIGFCLACEEEHQDVEPDARNYECEYCGAMQVFGAEECLMMVA